MARVVDIAARVSPELASWLARYADRATAQGPATLGTARTALAAHQRRGVDHGAARAKAVLERQLLAELDALIERHGAESSVEDFVEVTASEGLTRLIEAVMSDPNTPQRPTLGAVRDAMQAGLTARLAGEGGIELDEEQTLVAELEMLIERFGAEALAEPFMRYE